MNFVSSFILVEGLLSTRPTRSSFYIFSLMLNVRGGKKESRYRDEAIELVMTCLFMMFIVSVIGK